MAPSGLSWMTPATLACDLEALGVRVAAFQMEGAQRARVGTWFRHMLALGFLSETELIDALQPVESLARLTDLYRRSCVRWGDALTRLVCEHARGNADAYEKCLDV